jgi:hypothetical protein
MRVRFVAAAAAAQVTADAATRRITGRLVPFGEVATPTRGPARIEFAADGTHVPMDTVWLNREHDDAAVLGRAIDIDVRDDGVWATFDILPTTAGSDALAEAAAGARAGLSVEADIEASEDRDGTVLVTQSVIFGAALVRRPAFPSAGVTDVAATAANESEVPEEAPEVSDTPAVVEAAEQVEASAPIRLDIQPRPGIPTAVDYIMAAGRNDTNLLREYQRRIMAADPHTLTTDIAGLIPKLIVGPVVKLRDAQAPLFNALGPNAAPEGSSFSIPKVSTHLTDAAAATEKSDVTAPLDVVGVNVAMTFIKRAVNISYEAIQYSQPGVVGVAQDDLVDAVLRGCEAVAKTTVEAATGTNTKVTIALNGSDAWSKLSGAVSTQYGASGQRPDVFACAPDVWAKLVGFTNTLGSPLITTVNADLTGNWGTLFGLKVVVSPLMTAGKAYLLSTYGVKSWASGSVSLQLSQPTTFAYELGGGRNVGVSVADGKFITPVDIATT